MPVVCENSFLLYVSSPFSFSSPTSKILSDGQVFGCLLEIFLLPLLYLLWFGVPTSHYRLATQCGIYLAKSLLTGPSSGSSGTSLTQVHGLGLSIQKWPFSYVDLVSTTPQVTMLKAL